MSEVVIIRKTSKSKNNSEIEEIKRLKKQKRKDDNRILRRALVRETLIKLGL